MWIVFIEEVMKSIVGCIKWSDVCSLQNWVSGIYVQRWVIELLTDRK